ncbi:hypothetical protein GF337_18015 [candidate division KSB1 bacterium]|nr:hypothetical protein [candidate division KSB1 bacterium]
MNSRFDLILKTAEAVVDFRSDKNTTMNCGAGFVRLTLVYPFSTAVHKCT